MEKNLSVSDSNRIYEVQGSRQPSVIHCCVHCINLRGGGICLVISLPKLPNGFQRNLAFNFGPYRSNVTPSLLEAQIEFDL